MGETKSWRTAMSEALYGDEGFYTRTRPGGGPAAGSVGHFRTSARASPLFANAILRLVVAADEALGRPRPLEVYDVGAGGAHLLQRLHTLAPTYLAKRLKLTAVELAPAPPDLPDHITWSTELPAAGSVRGVVLATEWLDNVPLDVAEVDHLGVLRYVLVDPAGAESAGRPVIGVDAAWAKRWWARPARESGARVELGAPRDDAWSAAVASLAAGLAITVDYGHLRHTRPSAGTLTGFYAGRTAFAAPDGSCDLTAHVAIDAIRDAGEVVAGQRGVLTTQQAALHSLGVDATRPPVQLAGRDPAAYVQALAAASQAAELTDRAGLGGHFWVVQPVSLAPTCLPVGLRP